MLLAVVSDTHGRVEHTRAAIAMLESFEVDEVVHCGDIGTSDIVELFRDWPTHYVFGNVDDRLDELRTAMIDCGHSCHDRFGELVREGRRIAFLHGDDSRRLQETVECGQYDLVCFGHTHVAEQQQRGTTRVLNPGAVYRARRHSIAIVKLPELDVIDLAI